jgi:hypothetical protein
LKRFHHFEEFFQGFEACCGAPFFDPLIDVFSGVRFRRVENVRTGNDCNQYFGVFDRAVPPGLA